jgi:hypothetical protein
MEILDPATKLFGPLSEAERRMLLEDRGHCVVCGSSVSDADRSNDPQFGEHWDPARTVRAAVLAWLCRNGEDFGRTSSSGVHLYGAKITGQFNISYEVVSYPLFFERCIFLEDMSLKNARVPTLVLTGSHTRTVLADGIDVANNVLFNGGFRSLGQVLLRDAKIGGGLRTDNATFEYRAGDQFGIGSENSIGCDRMKVNGSVFLSKLGLRSTFRGEVGFAGAQVGSNFECEGGIFENPGRVAIRADHLKVVGSVYLRKGFSAQGTVRLLNAQMDVLDCTEGTFDGDGQAALIIENGTISSAGVFEDMIARKGAIQLRGVVAGDLTFRAAKVAAIDLRYATVRRALRMKRVQFTDPQNSCLDMRNASSDALDDDAQSWPREGQLFLDGFSYQRFGGVTSNFEADSTSCPKDAVLRLQWLRLDRAGPAQAYKKLASVYSASGETLSARDVLYHLEELLHRRQIDSECNGFLSRVRWGWSQWLKSTIGYGYKLGRSIYWLFALVVIGWLVSYQGYRGGGIAPADKDAYSFAQLHGYIPNSYPRFSATLFTLQQSIPVIGLGMSGGWTADVSPQNPAHPYFAKSVRIFLSVERALGWLLSLFFVAGITGLVKSEK